MQMTPLSWIYSHECRTTVSNLTLVEFLDFLANQFVYRKIYIKIGLFTLRVIIDFQLNFCDCAAWLPVVLLLPYSTSERSRSSKPSMPLSSRYNSIVISYTTAL